jgi:hypothetical protein
VSAGTSVRSPVAPTAAALPPLRGEHDRAHDPVRSELIEPLARADDLGAVRAHAAREPCVGCHDAQALRRRVGGDERRDLIIGGVRLAARAKRISTRAGATSPAGGAPSNTTRTSRSATAARSEREPSGGRRARKSSVANVSAPRVPTLASLGTGVSRDQTVVRPGSIAWWRSCMCAVQRHWDAESGPGRRRYVYVAPDAPRERPRALRARPVRRLARSAVERGRVRRAAAA